MPCHDELAFVIWEATEPKMSALSKNIDIACAQQHLSFENKTSHLWGSRKKVLRDRKKGDCSQEENLFFF